MIHRVTEFTPRPADPKAILAGIAARAGCSNKDSESFIDHLLSLPAYRSARMNPFVFAADAGVDPAVALDVFIHGAKQGVFDMEWGMVCPQCGVFTHSFETIDRVVADQDYCSLCRIEVPSFLDDTVEVSFVYTPPGTVLALHGDFTAYQHYFVSASYPYRDGLCSYQHENVVGQAILDPGESVTEMVSGRPGETHRVICLDIHASSDLQISDEMPTGTVSEPPVLTLTADGISPMDVTIPPGTSPVTFVNRTDQPAWCRVLRVDMEQIVQIIPERTPVFGPRLTGKLLLNTQSFRDCFAAEALSPDLKLKLRSLTLMFTDLKGSAALDDGHDDLVAYGMVQDHFAAVKAVVRAQSGAVIKTMGDAVLAAFPSPSDGAAAAVAIMEATRALTGRLPDAAGLKVGLHAGPALAIAGGNGVDYFGQTVSTAARVQGLANAGDICLTGALNDQAGVPDLLARAGYGALGEQATISSGDGEERVYRYRRAA